MSDVEAPSVEHLVNSRGEVMVLLGPLPSAPVAWRRIEGTSVFGLGFRDAQARYFTLPPQSIESAVHQARILVVEMGDAPLRDTWVGHAPA